MAAVVQQVRNCANVRTASSRSQKTTQQRCSVRVSYTPISEDSSLSAERRPDTTVPQGKVNQGAGSCVQVSDMGNAVMPEQLGTGQPSRNIAKSIAISRTSRIICSCSREWFHSVMAVINVHCGQCASE